jgi:broad specificity phosphatase PhoE
MTKLCLVRHGQTDWNLEGRYQGQLDISLNDLGRQQAVDLAQRLNGQRFSAIYSSDLSRAAETAKILSSSLQLPVRTDPRLREICHGEWQGILVETIKSRFQGEEDVFQKDPVNAHAPGGESVAVLAERMASAAGEIASRHVGHLPVLVVSHGLAIATLICQAGDISLNEAYSHIPENTQPVFIEWNTI